MAWGDVLGALGAGMAGVSQGYAAETAQRDKERLQKLHDETLQMIAQIGAKKATDVEEIRSEAKRRHDQALQVMNELTNSTKVAVAKDNNEKAKQIAQWYNDRHITETEMILLNRMSLAEYNDAAAQKRMETRVQGDKDVADINVAGRQGVEETRQEAETNRLKMRMPVDIWRNQLRYGGQQQGRRGAAGRRNQGPPPQKWGEFIAGYNDQGNQRLPSGDIQLGPSGSSAN